MKIGNLFASSRKKASGEQHAAEWKDIEYFDPVWEERVAALASRIKCRGRVVDFGCGQRYLRQHLSPGVEYIPVDYKSRSPDTVVADFNTLPYPKIDGEVAFMSGFLEYIEDPAFFIKRLKEMSYQEILISYCSIETVPSMDERLKLGWKNHYNLTDLLAEFLGGFALHEIGVVNKNTFFRFERER